MEKKYQNDYDLVHQYLCEDTDAGQRLYINTIPLVEKYIFKYAIPSGLSPDDVKDITSEALKRSIEKLPQYNGASKFSVWVIGIARNVLREEVRRRKKEILVNELENVIEIDFEDDISLHGQNPLHIVIRKETMDEINEAYDRLSPEHKDVIQLRFLKKKPAKAVAQLMGESVAAINSRFIRAMRAWRSNIKEIF